MIKVALVLLSLILLAHGADGTYRAVRGRTQVEMTCEQFARQGARVGWLRLTGCEVDYLHAGYREAPADLWGRLFARPPAQTRITELLFPVRPAGADAATPAALVVSTRDPSVLAIADRTLGSRTGVDEEAFLLMMLQVVTAMRVSPAVEGAMRAPLDTLRSRRALAGMRTPLTGGVAILDLHERPSIVFPLIELVAGLLGLLVALFPRARKPEVPATQEIPPPVATGSSRSIDFPRLMLLNLPATATLAELENAPPLGSQQDVRQKLAAALPGIQFDDHGRGRVVTPDYSVELELGPGDPVYTAVLDLRGDALAALASLLERTGWRAFAPKRGAFVTPADFD